jgi:hypothetical protein
MKINIHTQLYKLETKDVFKKVKNILAKYYEFCYYDKEDKDFILFKGEIPICLVAHIDTVFSSPPKNIKIKNNIMTSQEGLGADDRAGVSAILNLVKMGYKPYILLCDEEEVGCKGAKKAVEYLTEDTYRDINLFVEIDKSGFGKYTSYSHESDELDNYMKQFDLKSTYGSCSDISHICPAFGIAGINMECGYYAQHTKNEILNLNEWKQTILTIEKILKNPPKEKIEYKKKQYSYTNAYGAWDYEDYGYYHSRYSNYDNKKSSGDVTKLKEYIIIPKQEILDELIVYSSRKEFSKLFDKYKKILTEEAIKHVSEILETLYMESD